ncbi:hypothetical protein [Larkinella soli]|uniref:hypothetical protein n=1 Tax=Larkinella soli TaxID=1770527 RepID=UPI001E58ED93|nr:hypothetical protein [Larkinella soli]
MPIRILVRYVVLFLAGVIYIGGCSTDVMQSFYRNRLIPDDYRFGDLYRLANLPQFKAEQHPCPPAYPADGPRQPIHLYLIGDSFTEPQRISRQDFPVESLHRTKWDFPRYAQLDTSKTNILIIETVERHFRDHFDRYVGDLHIVEDNNRVEVAAEQPATWRNRMKQLEDQLSSKAVESRLETILFFSDWSLWFKELKARLTQNWFGRVDPKTSVTPDGRHLLYYLDTDTTGKNSSFKPLPDTLLNRYVDSLNRIADRYRGLGFDQVYLSIIPNKTSIVAPDMGPLPYNRLIERIQQSPRLTVPTIDIFSDYKASRIPLYEVSDAHWNCNGRAIWIRRVTEVLNRKGRKEERLTTSR